MESYKRGSHTVWTPSTTLYGLRNIGSLSLGGDVGERCRELIREIV